MLTTPDPGSACWNFMAHEERISLASVDAFRGFAGVNPWACNAVFAAKIARNAGKNGVFSRFHGHTREVRIEGANWRETIVAHGLNSRARAMLDEFADLPMTARILMLEAVTPFALAVRGRFPYAIGAEYLPTPQDRAAFFPIPHCDITKASYPDGVFDVVVSNDVLEHVPSVEAAMRETRRILKRGGVCLATFPFAAGQHESVVKAKLEGGHVVHLTEPEYHGNPVDPQGSLVFTIPGWDILDTCKDVGFAGAEMVFVSSVQRSITGTEMAGVFILRAVA